MELSPYLQNRWCARKGDGPGSPRAPSARRHPNQRLQWAVDRSRGLIMSARRLRCLLCTLRAFSKALTLQHVSFFRPRLAAHEGPLREAVRFYARGEAKGRLAEALEWRRRDSNPRPRARRP